MKNYGFVFLFSSLFVLFGCATFPLKVDIKDNHYRLENFKVTGSQYSEYLTRGCLYTEPNTHSWQIPQQYLKNSGKEKFWIQASLSKNGVPGVHYTYVSLSADFEANKSYMLNRKRVEFKVSIWIQEVETGTIVSNIAKGTYMPAVADQNKKRRQICGLAKEASF